MKFLTIIFLSAFFNSSIGQTTPDTINMFQTKATEYLNKIHEEHDFDYAIHMWDTKTMDKLRDIYSEAGKGILHDTALYNQLKFDFKQFYSTTTSFKIIKFEPPTLDTKKNPITSVFLLSYQEQINKEQKFNYSIIELSFNTITKEWKIADLGAIATLRSILGLQK